MKRLVPFLAAVTLAPAALAEHIVIYPGDTISISPIDSIYCAHSPGTAYDYCSCAKTDASGWTIYRYRKIYDGGGETLLIDPMSEPLESLVRCNQTLGALPGCEGHAPLATGGGAGE